jgi:LPXTG-motif cell wall-anchored protein
MLKVNTREVTWMSRNWERMVRKNAKTVNKNRIKQGIPLVSDRDKPQVYKGRSPILSLFFIGVSLFFILTLPKTGGQDSLSWFTTVSYFLLGLFMFFVRRPYLKVSKASLSKRGFIREHILYAENVKQIIIKPGYVFIEQKNSRQRWVYSKLLNRFDVNEIAGGLKSFSEQNHVAFVDERTL